MQFGVRTPQGRSRKKKTPMADEQRATSGGMFQALQDSDGEGHLEAGTTRTQLMFTPAYGARSRRNVTDTIANLTNNDPDTAQIIRSILERRPADTAKEFPMLSHSVQTKIMQAFIPGFDSLNITKAMVMESPTNSIVAITMRDNLPKRRRM